MTVSTSDVILAVGGRNSRTGHLGLSTHGDIGEEQEEKKSRFRETTVKGKDNLEVRVQVHIQNLGVSERRKVFEESIRFLLKNFSSL